VTAPTAVNSQAGPALTANAVIVIHFSEAMNPASLQLSGTLAADSSAGVWSKKNSDNDTLTLTPKNDGWTNGTGRTLNVDGKDLAGNALATLKASYAVNPAFDNFQPAAAVIGQSDFASKLGNQGAAVPGANTLNFAYGSPAVTEGGKLFIADYSNNRVLGYNSVPTASNANADFVLGQPDFTTAAFATNHGSHGGPVQLITAGGKLIVADYDSNRVVIYDSIPTSGAAVQSVVVGQPDFTSSGNACDASTLSNPETVAVTPGGKLIVTDSSHHRVLIWNAVPTANGQPADVVLGQGDFTHCIWNDNDQDGVNEAAPTARTLNFPNGVWTDGARLVISDESNNRVLVWNQIPTTNFQPADIVLGQPDFTSRATNAGGIGARTMNDPFGGVASDGVQLAITDSGNHRVLIWTTFPTSSFQPADIVLGQNAFNHGTANDDNQDAISDVTASARTLRYPSGALFYRDKLMVTDSDNSRVLIFKSK
jgi:hypothetical protein